MDTALDTLVPNPGIPNPSAGLRLGWALLQDCRLGDAKAAPIRFALLHPAIGVALLDLAPMVTPEATARLRQRLHASRFGSIFPGHLPIMHRALPARQLLQALTLLDYAFALEPPLSLPGGGAWMGMVQRALDPVLTAAAGADPATLPPGIRPVHDLVLVRRQRRRWPRGLLAFWTLLFGTIGTAGLLFSFPGPPAPVATVPPGEASPALAAPWNPAPNSGAAAELAGRERAAATGGAIEIRTTTRPEAPAAGPDPAPTPADAAIGDPVTAAALSQASAINRDAALVPPAKAPPWPVPGSPASPALAPAAGWQAAVAPPAEAPPVAEPAMPASPATVPTIDRHAGFAPPPKPAAPPAAAPPAAAMALPPIALSSQPPAPSTVASSIGRPAGVASPPRLPPMETGSLEATPPGSAAPAPAGTDHLAPPEAAPPRLTGTQSRPVGATGSPEPKRAAPARAARLPEPPAPTTPAASRCRAITLRLQLGEEPTDADRSFLRSGCGTR